MEDLDYWIEELRQGSQEQRKQRAFQALLEQGSGAVPALIVALNQDDSMRARLCAAELLGKLGDLRAAVPLACAGENPRKPTLRRVARDAQIALFEETKGKFTYTDRMTALLPYLTNQASEQQRTIALERALVIYGLTSQEVRPQVAETLSRVDTPTGRPWKQRYLLAKKKLTGEILVDSFRKREYPEAIEGLMEAWNQHPEHREEIENMLRRVLVAMRPIDLRDEHLTVYMQVVRGFYHRAPDIAEKALRNIVYLARQQPNYQYRSLLPLLKKGASRGLMELGEVLDEVTQAYKNLPLRAEPAENARDLPRPSQEE